MQSISLTDKVDKVTLNISPDVLDSHRSHKTLLMSQPQYETVVNHTTMAEYDADNHYDVASVPVYDGVSPGGSSSLFYQYVPSKVCGGYICYEGSEHALYR